MPLKFSSGNFEELKTKLSELIKADTWKEVNVNTYQAKLENGAVVNFYTSTGTIQFQGKSEPTKKLEALVSKVLTNVDIEAGELESALEVKANTVSEQPKDTNKFLSDEYKNTEIVIGLVGAIGVEYHLVVDLIKQRLERSFNYNTYEVRVSNDVIRNLPNFDNKIEFDGEYRRISYFMEKGNEARERYGNNAILSMGVSEIINQRRKSVDGRNAYIVNSLKHPEEVKFLREIYGQGFYLVGVFADRKDRYKYLTKELHFEETEAEDIISRDKDEKVGHGQHTSDTFDLSDFFVYIDEDRQKLKASLYRFLDLLFGMPTVTPTFEEYAMFMAFVSSLRSADLSRQVGAVITKNQEIIASGANDCPRYGGGLYWPYYDKEEKELKDYELGRDYTRGEDSNVVEKRSIIESILEALPENIDKETVEKVLNASRIKDLTEFGRVVHAEMEALMMCSRNNVSARNSVLFCTTFPCHNCAKHIIAAGIDRVVYIEPYPKSKALDFHSESIKLGFKEESEERLVFFEPFIGIGPRKFFDLFSLSLGSGRSIKRKNKEGKLIEIETRSASPKMPLIPLSYLEREELAIEYFKELIKN